MSAINKLPIGEPRLARLAAVVLLVLLSLPELLSPPISPTIARQTQTLASTIHFVDGSFSFHHLTVDVNGPKPFPAVYEFPLYEGIVGVLFVLFGNGVFWGKLISLVAAALLIVTYSGLVERRYGERTAWWAGLLLASSPITLLVSASFQPDALALALTVGAVVAMTRWRRSPSLANWTSALASVLLGTLTKFTVVVPLLPLLVLLACEHHEKWRVPSSGELFLAAGIVAIPFAAWVVYRNSLMPATLRVGEAGMFLVGNISRFLQASYYLKPVLILGGMGMCIVGVPLMIAGVGRADPVVLLLASGIPLYYALIPTAAEQTYYAWPLMPTLALLMARGVVRLEAYATRHSRLVPLVIGAMWVSGFSLIAPYTLRHDTVSLKAAEAVRAVSQSDDLIFVMNMHDRGVGIGGLNPSIVTLASRRGWNVQFTSPDLGVLSTQVDAARSLGARWLVTTWFTPELDPWLAAEVPAIFSRVPRFNGAEVNGRAITEQLAARFSIVDQGTNFAVLKLR